MKIINVVQKSSSNLNSQRLIIVVLVYSFLLSRFQNVDQFM